ncbi:MAG: molybdenum cofactor biosynthesis protein MoaE [Acidobacteria bacterium]|nr:molybdenum cofactor biosynthesis protein MoaE [Acidobacteriota bacterium]
MIQIVDKPIETDPILRAVDSGEAGAIVTFSGTVRNNARGKQVTYLFYEAYPELAGTELEKVRKEALRRWPLVNVAIVHRIGRMEIGDCSVFIAVSSPHREAAFEACRFVIDTLKVTVPIWKKEFYEDGEVWIEGYCGEISQTSP